MSDARGKWLGPRGGLVWLLPAAVALVFANGRWQFMLAALLAPFLFRLFLLTQPAVRGLALAVVIHIVAHLIMWTGIIPAPGWLYYAIASTYGLVYVVPFIVDRLVAPRLTGWKSTLVLPLAWYLIEIGMQKLTPYGSWAAAGYTQSANLALMQVAAYIGIAGVSFVVVWFGSAAAWLIVSEVPRRVRIRHTVLWAVLSTLVLVAGVIRTSTVEPPSASVRTALLTPSMELTREFNAILYTSLGASLDDSVLARIADLARQLNEDLLARSRQSAEAGARMVVWSELAGRVLKDEERALIDRGRALAQESDIYLFMGLGVWQRDSRPPLENKLVAITPTGDVAWEFQKARPIVGAEAHLLPPGHDNVATLETPYGRLAAVICHDLDFPDLVRQAGRQNADLLIGPSADWAIIKTIHARMAVVRAIENGLTLVRPTYAGLSVVADPYGRVVAHADDFDQPGRSFIVRVPTARVHTVYPMIAVFLPWLAGLALAGLIVLALTNRRT